MSTTYRDIRDAIIKRIKDNWTYTTVHWPGTKFKPGSDYIQPRIVWGPATQAALGQDAPTRISGLLHANVFTPIGKADDEAMDYVDKFRDLFPRNLRLAAGTKSLIFETPHAAPALEDEDWYQMPVLAPFYIDA